LVSLLEVGSLVLVQLDHERSLLDGVEDPARHVQRLELLGRPAGILPLRIVALVQDPIHRRKCPPPEVLLDEINPVSRVTERRGEDLRDLHVLVPDRLGELLQHGRTSSRGGARLRAAPDSPGWGPAWLLPEHRDLRYTRRWFMRSGVPTRLTM